MDVTGERLIPLPRETVWQALNDIDILRQAIPGCEEIAWTEDGKIEAVVTAKIGPVKSRFKGEVELLDVNPPASYTISGSGKGGAAGFANGSAHVRLTETDGGTLLTYEAKARVGGKLAQVGARIIQSAAKKLSDEFFDAFSVAVQAGELPEAVPAAAPAVEKAGMPPWIWASALAAIVLGALYFWATR